MVHRKAVHRPGVGDLLAFLGVLTTGVVLICIGHVPPQALAAVSVGLGSLYAAWTQRVQPGQDESGEELQKQQE